MNSEDIELRYMNLFEMRQRSQWENYVDEAHHDLSAIDEQIFALLSLYRGAGKGQSRREMVLQAIIQWTAPLKLDTCVRIPGRA
ncbi:MAG: hypothetical protein WC338_07925 [Candidatus Ratteibacteria bacterium]|jgi:hypothetical protein